MLHDFDRRTESTDDRLHCLDEAIVRAHLPISTFKFVYAARETCARSAGAVQCAQKLWISFTEPGAKKFAPIRHRDMWL